MTPTPEFQGYQPAEQEISNHELEREEILDRLERRANAVVKMQKDISNLEAAMPSEQFDQHLDGRFEEILSQASDPGRSGFMQLKEIARRRRLAWLENIKHPKKRLAVDLDYQNQMEIINNSNDESRFLSNLYQAGEKWKYKHRLVHYYDYSRPALVKDLKMLLDDHEIDFKRVSEVRTDGIQMIFVLESEYYDEVFPDNASNGTHFTNSP